MSSGTPAPDPSAPNALDQRVRQIVLEVLRDPLSYPSEMTNWLSTFVTLNAAQEGGTPVTQAPTGQVNT